MAVPIGKSGRSGLSATTREGEKGAFARETPSAAGAALTAREAAELLEVESRRLGVGTEVDRALNALRESQGVLPVLHPSERRLVGPFLDLVKRAMRRSMGWLLTP